MKTEYEILTDDMLDLEDFACERALARAFLDAVHRARVFNTNIVISKEGKVCEVPPNETAELVGQSLKFIAETNRKIEAYLDKHPEADPDGFHRRSLSEPLYDADPRTYSRPR